MLQTADNLPLINITSGLCNTRSPLCETETDLGLNVVRHKAPLSYAGLRGVTSQEMAPVLFQLNDGGIQFQILNVVALYFPASKSAGTHSLRDEQR